MTAHPPTSDDARLEDLQYWGRIKSLCEARRRLYRAQRQITVLSKVLGFESNQAPEVTKKGPDTKEAVSPISDEVKGDGSRAW